jgi:hypothetical protein
MAYVVPKDRTKVRQTIKPPMAPGMEFYVRKADIRAVTARQDLFDTVNV